MPAVSYQNANKKIEVKIKETVRAKKDFVGIDVFVQCNDRNPDNLGKKIDKIAAGNAKFYMITNRGLKVYPNGQPETFCTDHWRCRYKAEDGKTITFEDAISIMKQVAEAGFEVIKTEHLYNFDGVAGFSAGQGM
jgi:isocitrate dehydrogenase